MYTTPPAAAWSDHRRRSKRQQQVHMGPTALTHRSSKIHYFSVKGERPKATAHLGLQAGEIGDVSGLESVLGTTTRLHAGATTLLCQCNTTITFKQESPNTKPAQPTVEYVPSHLPHHRSMRTCSGLGPISCLLLDTGRTAHLVGPSRIGFKLEGKRVVKAVEKLPMCAGASENKLSVWV